MAIRPKKFDRGKVMSLGISASATLTKFNICYMDSGYLSAGAGGENEAEYVCLETVTDATAVDGSTKALVLPIDGTIVFEMLTGTTPVQATHVGNDYDLADAASIDLTATTDKVFHIDRIVNATDKLVEGRFNKPAIA
uniref:Uncharacterized protein n=1 Tax=viral metagenome TaxID=1070528 RepID=A0A6M3J3R4_9ZZZZ